MPRHIIVQYTDLDGSSTPVTNYCRTLMAQGEDPASTMEVWKNGILNMKVHSVGKAAKLTVHGIYWVPYDKKNKDEVNV